MTTPSPAPASPVSPPTPSAAARRLGWLVGAGILLTSATQLRVEGWPIGPGEIVLGLGLLVMAVSMARYGPRINGGLSRPWLWFWLAGMASMMAGWVVGIVSAESLPTSGRDAVAYGFSALMVALLVFNPRPAETVSTALRVVLAGTPLVIGSLAAIAIVGKSTGPVNVWYEGVRFRAWAANPNQLALLLAPQPWFALGVRRDSRHPWVWTMAVGIVVLLGISTGSDALIAAWLCGAIVIGSFACFDILSRARRTVLRAGTTYVVLPLVLLTGMILVGADIAEWIGQRASATYLLAGQGPDRLARWWFGLQALATSPIVGLGPGSFSGTHAPFSGGEAHNTPIDWATSTGLVGLAALVLLLGWVGRRVVQSADRWAGAALLVLLIFLSLHYMLRQPAAWFYLVVLSTAGAVVRHPARNSQ